MILLSIKDYLAREKEKGLSEDQIMQAIQLKLIIHDVFLYNIKKKIAYREALIRRSVTVRIQSMKITNLKHTLRDTEIYIDYLKSVLKKLQKGR